MASPKFNPRQAQSIFRLDGPSRYDHFIKEVVAQDGAWGLFDEGWAMGSDGAGKPTFPLWPSKELATACASGPWAEFKATEISLDDLVEELLPKLKEDQVTPSLVRSPDGKSVLPSVDQLIEDLQTEMSYLE
jgi:hypothetical protein